MKYHGVVHVLRNSMLNDRATGAPRIRRCIVRITRSVAKGCWPKAAGKVAIFSCERAAS